MGKALHEQDARAWRCWALALLVVTIAGCGLTARRERPPAYVANPAADPYPLVESPVAQALASLHNAAHSSVSHTRPLEVLVVCAGGVDSPFAAGAIVGWTKAGNRPTFDVVTGTSSGALVGAFAFLGPKYDGRLQAIFTEIKNSDLYQLRPVRYLLQDGVVASSAPLDRIIEREVTPQLLTDLRAAHAEGRRLFIGTTNVATRRLVVWDLTAIAGSGRPDADVMIRKILLASATWPALLPPVAIDVHEDGQWRHEQHIDGGTTAQAFVRFGPHARWPDSTRSPSGWLAGSNLYVLAGGKLYEDPAPPPERFFDRILNGFGCLTSALARADIQRLHTLCQCSGMHFHLLTLPDDFQCKEHTLMKIDPAELRRLFNVGHQLTATHTPWRQAPPGAVRGEEESPRGAGLADRPSVAVNPAR